MRRRPGAYPGRRPVDDGPLVANPEQDSLDMADMLYKQSQEPQTKANPQEYARLLDLSLRKYLEFSQRFPRSTQAPLAEYRAAMCLAELGRKEDAHALFQRLTQTGTPALVAASAYRLATDASARRRRRTRPSSITSLLSAVRSRMT